MIRGVVLIVHINDVRHVTLALLVRGSFRAVALVRREAVASLRARSRSASQGVLGLRAQDSPTMGAADYISPVGQVAL